jgi:hypothetical protein
MATSPSRAAVPDELQELLSSPVRRLQHTARAFCVPGGELRPVARDDLYHLTFILPRTLTLGIETGRHHPCLHRCMLEVDRHRARDYAVRVRGPSRELVFEQARRYLRVVARGHIAAGAALDITAVLITPAIMNTRGGRDGWTIIVGADVAFAPTTIPPDLPHPAEPRPPP